MAAALRGLRLLSLGLNLPVPVALQRCRQLGARCRKIEPPAGDPVGGFAPALYAELHAGIAVRQLDLKLDAGRGAFEVELARADVLLTSFRPSALRRLGLGWASLHRRHPQLWQIAVVGASGVRAEEAGHDLTYQAEQGLVRGLTLPASLYADMGGAQAAVQAVFEAALGRAQGLGPRRIEVGLGDAVTWLAQPQRWGLTRPGGLLGGAHAGYRVYACADGRVALAALEPHFGARLAALAGLDIQSLADWLRPATAEALAAWLASRSGAELTELARREDLPLVVCPDESKPGRGASRS